jgi:hypothetical protein|tara:strand:- start:695 stop:1129 length:435 start_codon:yes stop_codon:yes gene_type:complete
MAQKVIIQSFKDTNMSTTLDTFPASIEIDREWTDYDESVDELLTLAQEIEESKRPGYTQDSPDVLANFKKAAEMAGTTPMQAWSIYFYKHVAAIMTYAKDPDIQQGEALDGRFADAINYLKLGFHMFREEEEEQEFNNQTKLPF